MVIYPLQFQNMNIFKLFAIKSPQKGGYDNWWRGEDLNFRPSGYEKTGHISKSTGITNLQITLLGFSP